MNGTPLRIRDISAVPIDREDVESIVGYWYDSPVEYLRSIGVAPEKLPSRRKMREMLELKVGRPELAPTILAVKVRGVSVGVHELTHIEPRVSAVMHAHIWKAEHRGQGIGAVSYVKAMAEFFAAHEFQRVLFETPSANAGANRLKEVLGISPAGRGTLFLPIMVEPVETTRYCVERADMPAMAGRLEKNWKGSKA